MPGGQETRAPEHGRLPVLFVSHGSPMVALETDDYTRALEGWAGGVPRPTAIVVVSAHWQASRPVRVATSAAPATIHDFYGFPPELYALRYTPPGEPGLGSEIIARLQDAGIEAEADPGRGLDHGVWVPLRFLYPGAEVPVVAVSLSAPARPRELLALGRALAPLRAAGILILGSGGVVHNLGRLDRRGESAPVTEWARDSTTGSATGSRLATRRAWPRTSASRPTPPSPSRPASTSTPCWSPSVRREPKAGSGTSTRVSGSAASRCEASRCRPDASRSQRIGSLFQPVTRRRRRLGFNSGRPECQIRFGESQPNVVAARPGPSRPSGGSPA